MLGVAFRSVCTDVKPELSGGISCSPSIPAMCFLGDFLVGVEAPDPSRSNDSVSCLILLGEAKLSLRGRPRPRFGVGALFVGCTRGAGEGRKGCFFTGERVGSRVFARDELEEATIISSSSSCRGMRFLGIVNGLGLKKSVMFLEFLDMVACHKARY